MNDYVLRLSDEELFRYQMMAANAAAEESGLWHDAGIVPGARVADIGCGPGAVLAVLAGLVGPEGHVAGVDADPGAIEYARAAVEGLSHASTVVGSATASGLDPGSFDVAMCRHVLAHNGGQEEAIVEHLTSLVRPGGAVYIVDVDLYSFRIYPPDPDGDIQDRYGDFHAARGNDPRVGLRLGALMEGAGLTIEQYGPRGQALRPPPGMRPPSWNAREAMVEAGIATAADIERWGRMFERIDAADPKPWFHIPAFIAVGRKPS